MPSSVDMKPIVIWSHREPVHHVEHAAGLAGVRVLDVGVVVVVGGDAHRPGQHLFRWLVR